MPTWLRRTGMYRILLIFIGFILVFTAMAVPADSGVDRLLKFNQKVGSYEADFQQTIVDSKKKILEKAQGKMYLQRPGKIRWEYQTPYDQLIISDGAKIWLYDKELEQVTVKSLRQGIGDTPAMLLTSDRPLDKDFIVKELGKKQDLRWVELIPRDQGINFEKIELGFSALGIQTMELFDKLGQVTQIKFSKVQINPHLSQQLFYFSPPPDVDVIGNDS